MFVALLSGAGFVLGQVELPDEDPLLQSTFVCASDVTQGCGPDNAIAKLAGEEDRVSLPLEEIPQTFIDAVLAAEDRNFFTHAGIDPIGIARAVYQEVRGSSAQGGSTITQQYAKNAFLSSERTITRKLKEAVLAVKLEREFSKNEILQRYLNTVYFGRGAYGAEAAARIYFGVSIRNVDLSQAAYLAALIRSPESTDVARNPETAVFRRDSVLDGMLEEGWITRDDYDAARATELSSEVRERSVREGLGDVVGAEYGSEYYVEYIRRLLYDEYGADVVNGGGLRVYTSLDMDLQQAAYESVYRDVLDQEDDPAGALVSVDDVGRVVALVGGKDFDASEVNLALGALAGGSGRPPGSSFKPIVLAEALGQDISARSKFINENEIVLPRANNGDDWEVSNYSDGAENLVDLVEATKVSSNTVYAQLMLEVGPANVVALAEQLGVETPLPAVNALVLGSGDVSVLDMASAYSTFARRGEQIDPVFITKVEQVRDGEVKTLFQASGTGEQVMRRGDADQLNWILRQVVLGGTGSGANPGYPVAGKTGTSGDYRDAWFVGYSPRLTTAVWMGYPGLDADGNTKFMTDVRGRKVTGGSFPATIWKLFMQRASDGDGSFVDPPPFGGTVLNADLTTTTTTLPVCAGGDDDEDDDESTGTTEPCRTTTTTTAEPDDTTTTTSVPKSTTTTAGSSSTSTTQPDTSTTAAPTTTEFLNP